MKTIKTKNGEALKFYTEKEVFKGPKSKDFLDTYNEESMHLRLARQVRELRIKGNITQKELAKMAVMPQSVIARVESGTHSFSLDTLNRIARVFNKEVVLT